MFLVARALVRFPILAWGCWPIERALAGGISSVGTVWRTAIWDRLCTGLSTPDLSMNGKMIYAAITYTHLPYFIPSLISLTAHWVV